jgi:hypothetical protein
MSVHSKSACASKRIHCGTLTEFPSREGASDYGPAQFFTRGNTRVNHASLCKVVLSRCEPPWLPAAWETRKDEESCKSNGKTDHAVYDEQPTPTSHTTNTRFVLVQLGTQDYQ